MNHLRVLNIQSRFAFGADPETLQSATVSVGRLATKAGLVNVLRSSKTKVNLLHVFRFYLAYQSFECSEWIEPVGNSYI